MKAIARTQRRNLRQTGPGIALFPFLAVLICTMGALVPLLIAITRTVRLQAEAAALAKVSERAAELKTRQEDVRWRIEQLKRSRTRKNAQLADARLELGHLEDHARRLHDQLARHRQTTAELKRTENTDGQRVAQAQAELKRLQSQIKTAEQQLAQARQAADGRKSCYAVVPYEGPNHTHRWPIYLECRGDAVVLQPEGIELTEADFKGPLGPGNPLAAALRAAREFMLDQRAFDPEAGEPYPMLLVRPEGINAYYAARMAMQSWAFDFGYELIGDDWNLAYPPADPRLAEVVRRVIASARVSQARLAAAAPRHYTSRPKVVYRAAPRGGFVRETRPANNHGGRGYVSAGVAGPVGRAQGPGNSGEGIIATAAGTSTSAFSPGNAPHNGTETAAADGGLSPASATASGGVSARGASAEPDRLGRERGVGGGNAARGEKPVERPEGYVAGQPPREREGLDQTASADEQTGRVPRPGEWEPSPERRPPKRADGHHGKPDDNFHDKHDDRHGEGLAEKRGADWGLRNAARGSVGVTRPIPVICYTDRLVVVCNGDPGSNTTIVLGPRTEASIDTLISAIWEHMETWGIAGRGMYWRPLLHVYVTPDAERRFTELSALLEGSGLTVERRRPTADSRQ